MICILYFLDILVLCNYVCATCVIVHDISKANTKTYCQTNKKTNPKSHLKAHQETHARSLLQTIKEANIQANNKALQETNFSPFTYVN